MSLSGPTSGPVEGGRALFKGKVLGFPVHIDWSFIIIMAILGYLSSPSLTGLVVWVLITPVMVLAHELGHAVVARTTGAKPEIALAGFGGVTSFTPPRELSRARSIAISLAGPAVGIVIGITLLFLSRTVWTDISTEWAYWLLEFGIFTSLGWSVLNLLPILPLDGGQAMREFLPGDPLTRLRRAAWVSLVVALLAAAAAYYLLDGRIFLTIFLLFFAASNFMTVRDLSRNESVSQDGLRGPRPGQSPETMIVEMLWRNQAERARQVMQSLPDGVAIDLALHGAVLSLTGDPQQGHALLEQETQRRPQDPNLAAILALTQALEHDWDALIHTLQGPLGPHVPPPVMDRAVTEARATGREDVAGRLTVLRTA
ncbi:M50 family metallopeptidase [Kineosporia succinea]|uniref:Zn-dependent protease n=1 Tax=Kineosporia succinea TaxID=84632 RepID=A0ABT9P0T2_9ACTN|nr:site-2 protease family protein [Kineosporia succinea]MDP9825825.1 Zn-dependent protease [Kineosporia succinea]